MNKTLELAVKLSNHSLSDVVEFGIFRGKTVNQLRNSFDETIPLYGFDSFDGLPEDWTGTTLKAGDLSTKGEIPYISGVKIYDGWFEDTIKEYMKVANPIKLLHIDSDLYSSAITVLYNLKEFIVSGTIIVFDEWVYNHKDIEENRQHEQKAFYEWVKDFDIEYELIPRMDGPDMERQIVIIK